jgi:membrane protein YqaA with SNARE-associated domain
MEQFDSDRTIIVAFLTVLLVLICTSVLVSIINYAMEFVLLRRVANKANQEGEVVREIRKKSDVMKKDE